MLGAATFAQCNAFRALLIVCESALTSGLVLNERQRLSSLVNTQALPSEAKEESASFSRCFGT